MKHKLFIAALSVLLITAAGCKKGFLDVNTSPNSPTDVPPSVLLPTTTVGLGFMNANELGRVTSILVQHVAGTQNNPLNQDVYILEGFYENQWNTELFNGILNDLEIIIDKTEQTSPAYSGIAKLQKAYAFSVITDLWGDVPYSQAAQGLEFEKPRFDKQEDIYQGNPALGITGLIDLAKQGLADLNKTSVTVPTTDDLVYGGDLAKWKRMGNTLLLKLAIQLTNVNPTLAKSTIDAVITGNNYINANNLDFEVPFGKEIGNQNPIYVFNNVQRTSDMVLSTRFLNLMVSMNDTVRLGKLFTRPTGVYRTYENGATTPAPPVATRSRYNTYLTGTSGEAPIRLLTNFQSQFILAEAALILGTAGNADSLYKAGIRAHMSKIGMTTAEIDTFFANNENIVDLTGTTEEKRKQIITQKYIAFVGNGIEAYNDFRRTGYPPLAVSLNAQGDDPTVIPKRLPYPSSESFRNPNTPNPRPLSNVKVWWAK
jgi:hypothetical protein